ARARALTSLAPLVSQQAHLWQMLWAESYADLIRAAPVNAVRRLLERLMPAFSWDWLALPERRVAALTDICRRAAATGVSLTVEAARAIDGLLAQDLADMLLPLLPLLQTPDKETHSLLQQWRTHTHTQVAAHACLLLAEADQLDVAAIPSLVSLLADANDRSRYRATRLLHIRYGSDRWKTHALGQGTVQALVDQQKVNQKDARVGTILFWAVTNRQHDDPELLQAWLSAAQTTGELSENANKWLSQIRYVNDGVWDFIQGQLWKQTPRLQKPLLESIYQILQQEESHPTREASLRPELHRLGQSPPEINGPDIHPIALRCLGWLRKPVNEDYQLLQGLLLNASPLTRTASTALADLAAWDDHDRRSAVADWLQNQTRAAVDDHRAVTLAAAWARIHVKASSVKPDFFPLEDLLDGLADLLNENVENMLEALWKAGADDIPWTEYHERLVHAARRLAAEQTSLISWLATRLETAMAGNDWEERRIALAFLAASAEVAAGAFASRTDPDRLESLLIRAIDDAHSFSVRRFALKALGHLRQVSPAIVPAIRLALRDVSKVQADALQSVTNFRRVEGDITPALIEGLKDESAAAAYAVALVLEALGRAETTQPEQRQAILEALADTVRDPSSQRDVYIWEDEAIRHLGRLDQLLHQIIVKLAEGISG
ncbi:MAG: hypothetical protein KDE28_28765, partial [Anaerolineales bacterium]|nr:hypothetical protein [Anaerolineales bacterium]